MMACCDYITLLSIVQEGNVIHTCVYSPFHDGELEACRSILAFLCWSA